MASNSEQNNFGVPGLDKKVTRRKSGIPIPPTDRKNSAESGDDLKSMINRICKQMNDLDADIGRLKRKIDSL